MKCKWALSNELMEHYHDTEWGVPCHHDRQLFEKLILEGQQCGLSWNTILQKRENYRKAFCGFDPEKIVMFDEKKIKELMENSGIIRYDKKIHSIINNSRAYLNMLDRGETLDSFFWNYIDGQTIVNNITCEGDILTKSELSTRISKDLKKKGFNYVGPVTVYSFMEAMGMIDDHLNSCPQKNLKRF